MRCDHVSRQSVIFPEFREVKAVDAEEPHIARTSVSFISEDELQLLTLCNPQGRLRAVRRGDYVFSTNPSGKAEAVVYSTKLTRGRYLYQASFNQGDFIVRIKYRNSRTVQLVVNVGHWRYTGFDVVCCK